LKRSDRWVAEKPLLQKSAVERATRGILAAATAAGISVDIEVNVLTGVLKVHVGGDSGPALPAPADETPDDLRKLL